MVTTNLDFKYITDSLHKSRLFHFDIYDKNKRLK